MLKNLSKKKIIVSSIALVLVFAVIVGLALLPSAAKGAESSTEVITEIISDTVQRGNVTHSLVSGGTIADVDSVAVSLVGDIKLARWEVQNGDYVQEGDLLASVDRESVLASIEELTALIKNLDADIESHRYDTVSASVTSPRAGRVKAIYAQAGEDVSDTVQTYGALMLISLDGLMAVDIEAPSLPLGAGVTVTLSDGSEVKGTVESVTEGIATVTISDETAAPDECVIVSVDGKQVGEGTLYVHAALNLTGFAGTVARVNVAVNAPISASQSLITLENTTYTGDRAALLTTRRELEEELQALIAAYETGGVYASCAGRVSEINEALADDNDNSEDDDAPSPAASISYGGIGEKLMYPTATLRTRLMLLSSVSSGDLPPQTGDEPNTPDTPSDTLGATTEFIGRVSAITDNPDGTKTISIVSSSAQVDLNSATLAALGSAVSAEGIKVGDILVLTYQNDVLTAVSIYQNGGGTPEQGDGMTDGMSGAQVGGMSGSMSGGGMSGGGAASGSTAETSVQDYSVTSTALCVLTPYERADIIITVDELGIRTLAVGQEFTVTLDALPGQSFAGTVVEINPVGENSGGSTKYSVTISIDRAEDMLTGMNAAVRTPLQSREDVPIIPAAALNEDADGTFVYTSYNAHDDELGSPVYVTTGLSDGENVEILSGMGEGDVYYYRYASQIKYTFTRR